VLEELGLTVSCVPKELLGCLAGLPASPSALRGLLVYIPVSGELLFVLCYLSGAPLVLSRWLFILCTQKGLLLIWVLLRNLRGIFALSAFRGLLVLFVFRGLLVFFRELLMQFSFCQSFCC